MEKISSLFASSDLAQVVSPRSQIKKQGNRTERGDLLSFFTDELNKTRTGKFKPLSVRQVAVRLSYLKLADLYYLKSTCLDAERRGIPFSAMFWSSIKARDTGPGLGER